MAGSVNKVLIIGRMGQDPELRYTQGGMAVCNISVATSSYRGRGADKEEHTEWHRIVLWDKAAEFCCEYLRKGALVYVEGRLQTRKWTDNDGNDRYTTEIVGHDFQALGGRSDNAGPGSGGERTAKSSQGGSGGQLPFNPEGDRGDNFEGDVIPF